jgi:Caspase domain.
VIIYLSGHGNENQLDDGDYFFIPQDAEGDNEATFVTSWDIVGKFKKIRARHCILIVDACYSGMITNSAGTGDRTIRSTGSPVSLEDMPSKWIITSGRGTKVADGTGGNSPFATVLLNYLRDKSKPEDLKITRLISFLVENVPKLNELQVPLGVQVQGEGEPVFKVSNPSMK